MTPRQSGSSGGGGSSSSQHAQHHHQHRRSLHAHWDCSRGVSGTAMFAACLGAVKDPVKMQRWIDELQTLVPLVLPAGMINRCRVQFDHVDHKFPHVQYDIAIDESLTWDWNVLLAKLSNSGAGDDAVGDDGGDGTGAAAAAATPAQILSPWVLTNVVAVLTKLAEAEKRMACTPLETRPFIECVVEIVGAIWIMNRLGLQTHSCSPLPWTTGQDWSTSVRSTLKTPQMLLGMPIASPNVPEIHATQMEPLITDAAVALLIVLVGGKQAGKVPPMTLRAMSSGYDHVPFQEKKVGLLLGELIINATGYDSNNSNTGHPLAAYDFWNVDQHNLLETNIDDMTPEHLAFCLEQLLSNGAIDAWVSPVIMKKSRAAHTLHCLCEVDLTKSLLGLMFQHCTTLGVRVQSVDRVSLDRTVVAVETSDWIKRGDTPTHVDVKVGYLGKQVVSAKAEFEHCKAVALKTGLPIQSIAEDAVRTARTQIMEMDGDAIGDEVTRGEEFTASTTENNAIETNDDSSPARQTSLGDSKPSEF